MKRLLSPINILAAVLSLSLAITGIFATWHYAGSPLDVDKQMKPSFTNFSYGLIYITKINTVSGVYSNAVFQKTGDTKMSADVDLKADSASSVTVEVTFYNSTNATYYYHETETLSQNNGNIVYTVSGIEKGDEVPSKTYKTVTVVFEFDDKTDLSNTELLGELNFKFTVDKDSITDVVAQSAVDRFRDVLNNVVADDSYSTLETAMNNRGSWFGNKASAVTYIGNVAGADDGDSSVINSLFGSEFMEEDLDGDGVKEPITMMVKRLNLDNNALTGADYTYTSRNNEITVQGAEMTLYITAEQIGNSDIVVYAVTFTKLEGADEWTELVPLTKGTAETNSYTGGWGTRNSFNTDTWISDDGKTIEQLVSENMN